MVNVFRPDKLSDALQWLEKNKALPFAGGTDLMVHYRNYTGTVSRIDKPVLFTDAIEELKMVEDLGDTIKIGAACLLSELEQNELLPLVLRKAISQIAAPALRNRATMAGNVCNASPAGDTLPPLYIYDGEVFLASIRGVRTLPISEFISGPGKTVLKEDELLTHMTLRKSDGEKSYYRKVGTRAANALSKLTAAGFLRVENKIITDFALAFGAVAPRVVRRKDIEKTMTGKSLDNLDIEELCKAYAPYIIPIDDQRSTALYRKEVALNLIKDFIGKMQEIL